MAEGASAANAKMLPRNQSLRRHTNGLLHTSFYIPTRSEVTSSAKAKSRRRLGGSARVNPQPLPCHASGVSAVDLTIPLALASVGFTAVPIAALVALGCVVCLWLTLPARRASPPSSRMLMPAEFAVDGYIQRLGLFFALFGAW